MLIGDLKSFLGEVGCLCGVAVLEEIYGKIVEFLSKLKIVGGEDCTPSVYLFLVVF